MIATKMAVTSGVRGSLWTEIYCGALISCANSLSKTASSCYEQMRQVKEKIIGMLACFLLIHIITLLANSVRYTKQIT